MNNNQTLQRYACEIKQNIIPQNVSPTILQQLLQCDSLYLSEDKIWDMCIEYVMSFYTKCFTCRKIYLTSQVISCETCNHDINQAVLICTDCHKQLELEWKDLDIKQDQLPPDQLVLDTIKCCDNSLLDTLSIVDVAIDTDIPCSKCNQDVLGMHIGQAHKCQNCDEFTCWECLQSCMSIQKCIHKGCKFISNDFNRPWQNDEEERLEAAKTPFFSRIDA